jgi:hypothetical protein
MTYEHSAAGPDRGDCRQFPRLNRRRTHDSCSDRQLTTVCQKLHIGPEGVSAKGRGPPHHRSPGTGGKLASRGGDGHFRAGFEEQVRSERTRRGRQQHQFAGARSP